MMSEGALPSIGPAPVTGWGRKTHQRKEQIQIWSAVALQQHFARSALVHSMLPTLEEIPLPMRGGRLTLAQKMGLVPMPPPAPNEEEWARIEGTALRRGRTVPMGSNACCICQEPFYATMEQGQVILSCSHVFHEQCFRHFERFAWRSRGKYDATPLCCPMCRNAHYHKRVFYAGKAMAQRAAIVKIQSIFRMALARKAYNQMRLQCDDAFRNDYVRARLACLSGALEEYAARRERERELLLDHLDLRRQRALAECTTSREWSILRKRLSEEPLLDCPICLCAIERNPNGDEEQRAAAAGEEIVASYRREYEMRVAQERQESKARKKPTGPTAGRASKVVPRAPLKDPKRKQSSRELTTKQGAPERRNPMAPVNPASSAPRYGVMLSCGHCLHETCLTAFERYLEVMAVQRSGESVISRCPLCRSAYATTSY